MLDLPAKVVKAERHARTGSSKLNPSGFDGHALAAVHDAVHPNDAGFRAMAAAIDLSDL